LNIEVTVKLISMSYTKSFSHSEYLIK